MQERYEVPADQAGRGQTGVKGKRKTKIETKIAVAKRELLRVLATLRNGVAVNIIRFSTFVHPWKPALEPLSVNNRSDAAKFVKSSTPGGLTNIYEALRIAFQSESVDTIYLLSDGAPTVGKYLETDQILSAVGRLNRFRKVKINAIGFNLKPDERKLMEDLSDQNFGVFLSK